MTGPRQPVPRYQPEVDGLRAIAVGMVLLSHLGVPGCEGGFTGVDVFFVISGYLVTRLIRDEVQATGGFAFARFYARRTRRLVPALLTTIAVTWVFAFLVLSPGQMADFGASALAATFSASNFYFWSQAGYFDASAITKPLLHTWSLGVEEQFYLVWPLLLSGLLGRKGQGAAIGVVVLVALASLGVAEWWLRGEPDTAFYLLPSRAMELAIGALMVWAVEARPARGLVAEFAAGLGLGLIAASCLVFHRWALFPGFNALVPCLGTALFLWGARARWAPGVLRTRVMVGIGRISYSVYLVHWPLIVLWLVYSFTDPTPTTKLGLLVASLGLGWLQFRLVEQRFRERGPSTARPPGRVFAAVGVVALPLAAISLAAYLDQGLPWRVPPERLTPTVTQLRDRESTGYCAAYAPDLVSCQNQRGRGQAIFLWGDSHARHWAPGFAEAYPGYDIFTLYSSACPMQSGFAGYVRGFRTAAETQACVERNHRALELFAQRPPTTVVLASAQRDTPAAVAKADLEVMERLRAQGHRVLLLGDTVRPKRALLDCVNAPGYLFDAAGVAGRCRGDATYARWALHYNEELERLIPGLIRPDLIQCPEGHCRYLYEGRPLFRDDHHLSIEGSTRLIAGIKDRLGIPEPGVPPATEPPGERQ